MDQSHTIVSAINSTEQASRRKRKWLKYHATQTAIVAAAVAVLIVLAISVKDGLASHGIKFSFSFLWNTAGFDLSEGKTLGLDDGYRPYLQNFSADGLILQAFITGIFNTIKIAVLAIIFSTLVGTLLGVGRLSTNWLVRNLSFWVIEFVRNTPLLIQLVFWYFAVVLKFPPLAAAVKLYGAVISQQGIYFPWPTIQTDNIAVVLGFVGAFLAALVGVFKLKSGPARIFSAAAMLIVVAASFVTGVLGLDTPATTKFRVSGGTGISPEMAALLLAIVVNSAAYIAEIIRGAIDALPRGQWEAAASLGLARRSTINEIILPQVFRVVLPSFGNQYISLTKNTALGIAIGYPELFNVYGTIANQTGHSLEGILIVMLAYLIISWIISALVGFADRYLTKGTAR